MARGGIMKATFAILNQFLCKLIFSHNKLILYLYWDYLDCPLRKESCHNKMQLELNYYKSLSRLIPIEDNNFCFYFFSGDANQCC